MLHSVSWGTFLEVLLIFCSIYYALLGILFYHQKIWKMVRAKIFPGLIFTVYNCCVAGRVQAQDGTQGINQANQMIRGYFDPAVQLMYGIGAIFGLIGAVRVYHAFHGGHGEDARRHAVAWFGACIFLVIVATVIRSFFGL